MSNNAKRIVTWVIGAAVVVGGGALVYRHYSGNGDGEVRYQTQPVEKGRVVATVTATGTLSPLNLVQVGSQVSGRILELHADFNSEVTKGQVIARIDPSIFESNVAKARANLQSAKANVTKAQAALEDAKQKHDRARALAAKKLVAQAEVDTARATYKSAKAQEVAARAALAQSRAALEQTKVNLDYTTIFSPIDGTVISRDVDVGQTVAASLQAPTLFTIAEDLREMELHTSVAESDVGKLRADIDVTFTVDAFPDDRFRGLVKQIRNSPQTVQNVVTYNAVVQVENDELKLRPGMTANVTFIVARKRSVIVVPNTALRFSPPEGALAHLSEEESALATPRRGRGSSMGGGAMHGGRPPATAAGPRAERPAAAGGHPPATAAKPAPGGEASAGRSEGAPGDKATPGNPRGREGKGMRGMRGRRDPSQRVVWVMVDELPRPIQIQTGISDGTVTEVKSGALDEGATLITGMSGGKSGGKPPSRMRRGRFL